MSYCNFGGLMRTTVTALAAATLGLAWPGDAAAVIVHGDVLSSQTPAANLAAPTGGLGDPGWDNVGWGSFGTAGGSAGTAVYLGNGWVLTANHTKGGSIRLDTDDPSGGTTYSAIAGTGFQLKNPDNSNSELWMYRINGDPGLPMLNIAQTSPTVGDDAIVIGTGVTRGSGLDNYKFEPGGIAQGYEWGSDRDKAWGATQVSTLSALASYGGLPSSYTFESNFDSSIAGAAAGADKDSGSAMFIYNSDAAQWELAGILIAVTNTYGGDRGTEQDPEPFVLSQFGNQTGVAPSAIVAVDLAPYYSQIAPKIIPEPTSLTLLGVGALALLRRRGRREKVS